MEEKKDLFISVDDAVFNAILNNKQHELTIGLDEDNKEELIYAQGNSIVLMTEELPEISYGAYLFNKGVFPYKLQNIKTLHVVCNQQDLKLDVVLISAGRKS